MRKINEIILHHSATQPTLNSFSDYLCIKKAHKAKGWLDVGYHFVIGSDGQIFRGRSIYQVGAHCQGHNSKSIGICLIGDFTDSVPTDKQLDSLRYLVVSIRDSFDYIPVYPHNSFRNTICPGKFLTDYCKILNSISYVSSIH